MKHLNKSNKRLLQYRVSTNDSKKQTGSIFTVKDRKVPNESEVVGNCSDQLRVTTVTQLSFHMTECDFKRMAFLIKP
jgi:hypothetical protein